MLQKDYVKAKVSSGKALADFSTYLGTSTTSEYDKTGQWSIPPFSVSSGHDPGGHGPGGASGS
jgi:hypothetical protein